MLQGFGHTGFRHQAGLDMYIGKMCKPDPFFLFCCCCGKGGKHGSANDSGRVLQKDFPFHKLFQLSNEFFFADDSLFSPHFFSVLIDNKNRYRFDVHGFHHFGVNTGIHFYELKMQ